MIQLSHDFFVACQFCINTCERRHVSVRFNPERAMSQVPRREVEVLGEGTTSLLLLPVQGEGCQQGLKGTSGRRQELSTGHQSSVC